MVLKPLVIRGGKLRILYPYLKAKSTLHLQDTFAANKNINRPKAAMSPTPKCNIVSGGRSKPRLLFLPPPLQEGGPAHSGEDEIYVTNSSIIIVDNFRHQQQHEEEEKLNSIESYYNLSTVSRCSLSSSATGNSSLVDNDCLRRRM